MGLTPRERVAAARHPAERNLAKVEAFAALPSWVGRQFALGPYTATVGAGPDIGLMPDEKTPCLQLVLYFHRGGRNVTPFGHNAWKIPNPPLLHRHPDGAVLLRGRGQHTDDVETILEQLIVDRIRALFPDAG